jgi:hypothetical protein
MNAGDMQGEPWADVSLPRGFDAREIYEHATSVGEVRRQQRKQRQTVLTAFSCVLVGLSAIAIVLSRSDAATNVSVSGPPPSDAAVRIEQPAGTSPRATTAEAGPERTTNRKKRAKAPREPEVTTPSIPIPRRGLRLCRARAIATNPPTVELLAFHGQIVPDTTTTTEPPPPPTTTTTTRPPPPPPPRTTTTKPKPPNPPRTTTTIVVSPEPPVSSPPPPTVGGTPPMAPRPRYC